MSAKGDGWYSDGKKIEVVTTYLIMGSVAETSRIHGIPEGTIYRWKTEPWWKEMVDQVRADEDTALDAKLAKRIEKALDIVQDRLDNGDFILTKEGEIIRRPVSMKDTWKVNKEMIDVRMLIRKEKPVEANQQAVSEILTNLAKEFAAMAKRKAEETFDAEPIQATVNPPDEKGQVLEPNG